MKKITLFVFVAVFFVVGAASAAQVAGPMGDNGNVVVSQGSYNDLYTGGSNVAVQTDVAGDLFAGGGSVTVPKNVGSDLFAAGGNVNISGNVSGDARVAGGTVSITGEVNEDILVAGGTVLLAGKRIGGDLWAAGGSVVVNTEVAGNVEIRGNEVFINGTITGPVNVVAEKLTFGPQSRITGTVAYKGPHEAVIETGAVVPGINYEQAELKSAKVSLVPIFTIAFFVKLIAMFLAALLLLKFFGKTTDSVALTAYRSPWKSFGLGLAGIILVPILTVLLFVTVIGFYIGIAVLAAFVLTLIIGGLLASIFAGGLIMKWIKKREGVTIGWIEALVGIVALALIGLIPFIGWIVVAATFLTVLGSFFMTVRDIVLSTHMRPSENKKV